MVWADAVMLTKITARVPRKEGVLEGLCGDRETKVGSQDTRHSKLSGVVHFRALSSSALIKLRKLLGLEAFPVSKLYTYYLSD